MLRRLDMSTDVTSTPVRYREAVITNRAKNILLELGLNNTRPLRCIGRFEALWSGTLRRLLRYLRHTFSHHRTMATVQPKPASMRSDREALMLILFTGPETATNQNRRSRRKTRPHNEDMQWKMSNTFDLSARWRHTFPGKVFRILVH